MKALKIIGIVLLIIIVLLLIIALFLPKEMKVNESVVIKAPAEKVYNQVNDLKIWTNWSPWQLEDTTIIYTYEGSESGVGAKSIWKSVKQGDGTQEIIESIPFSDIKIKLELGKRGIATSDWTFEESGESTAVSWGITMSDLAYPHERLFILLMKGRMMKDFKKGLEGLKTYVENLPDEPKEMTVSYETEAGVFEITEKQIDPQPALIVREMVSMDEVSKKIGGAYQKLGAFCTEMGIEMGGAPFTMWPSFNMEGPTEMIAGFPIAEAIEGKEGIESFTIPGGNVIMSVFMGDYMNVGPTYNAIEKYISEKGKEINGAAWEVYVTDPASEPDTSKWITHIYYPVK